MFRYANPFFDEKEKIWYGPKKTAPIFNPDCSIGRVLFNIMKLRPKAVALVSDTEGTVVTYEELLRDSVRLALQLRKLLPNQNDIVGIVAGQATLSTHIELACLFNTIVFHPVNPAHEQAVLEHLYAITRPKVIFCEGKYYEKVQSACKTLKLKATIYTIDTQVKCVTSIQELIQPDVAENTFKPRRLVDGGSQTVLILNSSGTSGLPKAVCYSNHNLCSANLHINENSNSLVFGSLDWVTSILYTVLSIYACGRRILTLLPFSPEYFVELVEKYKINSVVLPPAFVASLVQMKGIENADLSSLSIVFCGGALMSPTILIKFRELLKDEKNQRLLYVYGCTELGGSITTNKKTIEKPTSVGKILPGIKVKIISDDGQNLGVREIGEVLANINKKWNGYYGNPEETRNMQDEELWIHTGDLGYFDEDGDLHIVDRKKDILKYRSMHYSPHEIEEVISQLPDVVEVCVFGNHKDTLGDCPAAAIVRRDGSQLTEEEVIRHVEAIHEVEWKRLSGGVFFVKSLPKTGTGKIIRRDTKKIVLGKL